MSKKIPVTTPWLGPEEEKAAADTIHSRWVTQGPQVKAFEDEFAQYLGTTHASAVVNCTAALHLALKAVGVDQGDEVITTSHSFIATANAIRSVNAVPVLVDIQPDTFNIDPALVEKAINDKTKAVVAVHQIGMPCDLKELSRVCKDNNIKLIEDAACAIGSEIEWNGNWEKIGKPQGDIACFSFHPRKILTTGDGGMLTTNNSEWDKKFKLWRQHSMSVSDTQRHQAQQVTFEEYTEYGFNFRMTDIQAAVGREQLKKLPAMIKKRRDQAQIYRDLLKDVAQVTLPQDSHFTRSNWQSFCIKLADSIDQKQFMQKLLDQGISTRRAIMNIHLEKAYASNEPWKKGSELIHCEKVQNSGVILPLFHELTEDDQKRIADEIKKLV